MFSCVGDRFLVFEVVYVGEDYCDVVFVGCGDDFFVVY